MLLKIYIRTPKVHQSDAKLYGFPSKHSGAIYSGVPQNETFFFALNIEIPKSHKFAYPSLWIRTFSDFKSL